MISVAIPIFNRNVDQLVQQLLARLNFVDIDFELLLWDDGSDQGFKTLNAALARELDKVHYFEFTLNKGRSAARNRLAEQAKYDYILFLDNDVEVLGEDFFSLYLDQIQQRKAVIYGGITYPDYLPAADQFLRWKYERRKKKGQHPIRSFGACNFMVKRSIMTAIPFDESLEQYGFEDTLWLKQVFKAGHTLTHIPNPVFCSELDDDATFFKKSDLAMQNLAKLYQSKHLMASDGIRILEVYENFKAANRFWLSRALEKVLPFQLFPVQKLQLFKLNRLHQYLK
ncbi:MAG: glycosyltransferase [Saprospiraceae bacterium]|nr:glycosyltransferase [Saprospiraceae bacterium]